MKQSWIEAWRAVPKRSKIFSLVSLACAVAVIVLSILTIADVGDFSLIFLPLMALVSLLSGIETYRSNKGSAIFSFVASGVVLACWLAILLIRILV